MKRKHIKKKSNKSNIFVNFFEKTRSYFVNTFSKQTRSYTYRRCAAKFYFNNKLYKHVKNCNVSLELIATKTSNIFQIFEFIEATIIQSTAISNNNSNFGFRN